jgi:glycosyltransferase involved in cell wall biosynthesis
VLFVSAMTEAKGADALAEAYLRTSTECREVVSVDFAGMFESEVRQARFMARIAGVTGLRYLGTVDEERKRQLFAKAHVFCLPTEMFEGQPISILEAYASGCVVLTTGQPGIRDVFRDGANGFELQRDRVSSIARILEDLARDPSRLASIAMKNRELADIEYTTRRFNTRLRAIVERTAL